MRCHRWGRLACPFALLLASIGLAMEAQDRVSARSDWPAYGNDAGGMRHSSLSQINRENVAKLKVAWVFHTGDISDGKDGRKRSGFETTPILVDGTLHLPTRVHRVTALNPATG